ncbi:hypothetical protein ONZ45_g13443 [Pleurotus djamor]|nr:hypothetical protein ONZ45_g13443 [Pleurotus djamor]
MNCPSEPAYDPFQELFEWFQAAENSDFVDPEEAWATALDDAEERECNPEARTTCINPGAVAVGDDGEDVPSSENVSVNPFGHTEAETPRNVDLDSNESRRRVDAVRLIMTVYSRLWVAGTEYTRFHAERDAAFEIIELSQEYGGMERSLDDVHSRIRAWMLLNARN